MRSQKNIRSVRSIIDEPLSAAIKGNGGCSTPEVGAFCVQEGAAGVSGPPGASCVDVS